MLVVLEEDLISGSINTTGTTIYESETENLRDKYTSTEMITKCFILIFRILHFSSDVLQVTRALE